MALQAAALIPATFSVPKEVCFQLCADEMVFVLAVLMWYLTVWGINCFSGKV